MDKAFKTPPQRCRACGHSFNRSENIGDIVVKPEEGDFTVCIRCGALHVFTALLTLRPPTKAEERAANDDPDIVEFRRSIAIVNRLN